jgi:hypothetical protein
MIINCTGNFVQENFSVAERFASKGTKMNHVGLGFSPGRGSILISPPLHQCIGVKAGMIIAVDCPG